MSAPFSTDPDVILSGGAHPDDEILVTHYGFSHGDIPLLARESTEALQDLMGVCRYEPAEPEVCVCCAAYMEVQRREAEPQTSPPKPFGDLGWFASIMVTDVSPPRSSEDTPEGYESEDLHDMTLSYTIDDNGVWLVCSCGWEKNLGYGPSPDIAALAAGLHRAMNTPTRSLSSPY